MDLPSVMSGVQLVAHGGPESLVWNEAIPMPRPGPGEALVQVLAAGVNNTDINTRVGWYAKEVTGATADTQDGVEAGGFAGALNFPLIQGGDLCGRVVVSDGGPAVGARVTCQINQPEPTDAAPAAYRVIGSDYDGAFAEFCAVPVCHLHDVSASPLSDVEIAAMPCAFGTAAALLDRAGVGEGDRVLITGASGGVGLAAVQLAALDGAAVTGVASAAKQDAVREAGAHAVLGREDVPGAGTYDAVVDLVGGPGWGGLIDALRPGGRYAVAGAIAGPIVEADLRTIYLNDISIFGTTFQPAQVFERLVERMNAGTVRPLISATYPLADIHRAQADFDAKTHAGKLVLIPPGQAAGEGA
ncbi:MAG: zinc-binding dehydrogenase [Pseudomonadota bacterium]